MYTIPTELNPTHKYWFSYLVLDKVQLGRKREYCLGILNYFKEARQCLKASVLELIPSTLKRTLIHLNLSRHLAGSSCVFSVNETFINPPVE